MFRCWHLLRRHRQVNCRSLVQVCMVRKVSILIWLWKKYLEDFLKLIQVTSSSCTNIVLFFYKGALGFSIRSMSNNNPQLNRSLTQGTQLPSHSTPTTGVPTMSLHTPPSPNRYTCFTCVYILHTHCTREFQNKYPSKCHVFCSTGAFCLWTPGTWWITRKWARGWVWVPGPTVWEAQASEAPTAARPALSACQSSSQRVSPSPSTGKKHVWQDSAAKGPQWHKAQSIWLLYHMWQCMCK